MHASLIDWFHLLYLATFLTVARILQFVILTFYGLFPFPGLLDRLYLASRGLQKWFSFKLGQEEEEEEDDDDDDLDLSSSSKQRRRLRRRAGETRLQAEALVSATTKYSLEHHHVRTEDGFVLVLHRLVPKASSVGVNGGGGPPSGAGDSGHGSGSRGARAGVRGVFGARGASTSTASATEGSANGNASGSGSGRPPVLLMHALMQDSEAFLCGGKHSLALFLADAGFDVWLGNNRGNRYSHKHLRYKPSEDEYWNFSIDELARYDVPALLHYVLQATGHAQLRYVGFSQGSAQAFAAFTMDQALASKVKLFVALAAPPRARGLSASYLTSLVESNPRFIYLLFGKHAMLASTLMWMKIMSPQLFVYMVDRAVKFLFDWSATETSHARKLELYQHIFSYASVKTVVQWFQLIKLRRLAMYSDDTSSNRVPVEYDLKRLSVPTAVFMGGKDTVVDNEALQRDLPQCISWHLEPDYEHLDMIWADSAVTSVFPKVASLLRTYSDGSK